MFNFLEDQIWRTNFGGPILEAQIKLDRWILFYTALDQGSLFFAILYIALVWACRSETQWLFSFWFQDFVFHL